MTYTRICHIWLHFWFSCNILSIPHRGIKCWDCSPLLYSFIFFLNSILETPCTITRECRVTRMLHEVKSPKYDIQKGNFKLLKRKFLSSLIMVPSLHVVFSYLDASRIPHMVKAPHCNTLKSLIQTLNFCITMFFGYCNKFVKFNQLWTKYFYPLIMKHMMYIKIYTLKFYTKYCLCQYMKMYLITYTMHEMHTRSSTLDITYV